MDGGELSTETYLLAALACGLTVADLDLLSIGMVMDLFLEKTGEGYTEISGDAVDSFFLGG